MAGLIEIAVARQQVFRRAHCLPAESIPLANALGRITATSIQSPFDQPSYTKSLVDGFALSAEDLNADGRIDGPIKVSLDIFAGDATGSQLSQQTVAKIDPLSEDVYRYMNFDQIAAYQSVADKVIPIAAA